MEFIGGDHLVRNISNPLCCSGLSGKGTGIGSFLAGVWLRGWWEVLVSRVGGNH